MCTEDDLDMDDTIINDNEADYDAAQQAADALDVAQRNLCRINSDLASVGYAFIVDDAIEYAKTTALIGIGHALNAIAQALNNHNEADEPDVADMLTHNIITEQFHG